MSAEIHGRPAEIRGRPAEIRHGDPDQHEANNTLFSDGSALALLGGVLSLIMLAGLWVDRSFFLRDDFLNYYLGAFSEISRALTAGEFPLLTPLSWQSGALGGEYQYGLFSPVLLLVNLILFNSGASLPLIAAILVWSHLLILSSGAYLLARGREHSPELSLMVALASSLNGWIAIWGVNWFGALAAIAWIPWAWWALERAQRRHKFSDTVLAGLFTALIFTAGFPYACLMAIFVIVGVAGRVAVSSPYQRPFSKPVWRKILAPGWSLAIGLGLSAPAWLMLVEYSSATMRSQNTARWFFQTDLTVPFKALFGTLLPRLTAPWRGPWLPADDTASIVMHSGLAPVVLLVTAFWVLRSRLLHKLDYDFLLLATLFLLMAAPGLGVMRWSFRWLPLFFLQTALTAAGAVRWMPATTRRQFGRTAWILVVAVSSYALLVDGARDSGTLALIVGEVVLVSLWWGIDAHDGLQVRMPWLRLQMPWLVVPISALLTFGNSLESFPIHHRRVEPQLVQAFDPAVTYLALYTLADNAPNPMIYPGQRYFPGNEHLHDGLRLVNGYSPLQPAGLAATFGFNYLGAMTVKELAPEIAEQPLGPLLRRMAVDGLILWPESRELRNIPFDDFERATGLPEAEVYHRRSEPSPRVQVVSRAQRRPWIQPISLPRLTAEPILEHHSVASETQWVDFGPATLTVIKDARHHVKVEVDTRTSKRPALVSFARPWFPGYRATLDGEPTDVQRLDFMMPAIEVPAGRQAEVVLAYRPTSVAIGCGLVLLTLIALVGRWTISLRSRLAAEP